MGRIHLKGVGSFGTSGHTAASYSRDVTPEQVAATIRSLADSAEIRTRSVCCLVLGMGAQPRSVFRELARQPGVSVLFVRSLLPGALGVLRPFIASYEGLVRIEDANSLEPTFLALMDRSMVGLYCFEPDREKDVVAAMKRSGTQFEFGLPDSPGYLIYVIDADNSESSTGIHEIVSYGKEVPESLLPPRLRLLSDLPTNGPTAAKDGTAAA